MTRINITVCRNVVPCSTTDRYEDLEKIFCLTTLNLEAAVSSETSVPKSVYIAVKLLIPDYRNILG